MATWKRESPADSHRRQRVRFPLKRAFGGPQLDEGLTAKAGEVGSSASGARSSEGLLEASEEASGSVGLQANRDEVSHLVVGVQRARTPAD